MTRIDAFKAITTLSVDGKQTEPFTLEISRPEEQQDGEAIAREIEARSIETLVKPYENVRAYTRKELLDLLNHPEKRTDRKPPQPDPKDQREERNAEPEDNPPAWLEMWIEKRIALQKQQEGEQPS